MTTDVDVAGSLRTLRGELDAAIVAKRHELEGLQAERQKVTEWIRGHQRDNGKSPAAPAATRKTKRKTPSRRYSPSSAAVDAFVDALKMLKEATAPEIAKVAGMTAPAAYTVVRHLEGLGAVKQVGTKPRPDGTGRSPALWALTAQPEPWEHQHQAT